jgi:hypothetical protein
MKNQDQEKERERERKREKKRKRKRDKDREQNKNTIYWVVNRLHPNYSNLLRPARFNKTKL